MNFLRIGLRPFAALVIFLVIAMVVTHDVVYGSDDKSKLVSSVTELPEVVVKGNEENERESYNPKTVSSTKYSGPLRDIPQTIAVIPEAVMRDQNSTTLRETLRNVPGISIQAGEGGVPAGDQLSIRGFSARTDMFIDGIRDIGGYTRDPFNFEQIEVVKGPASSYTGRGSTGGSINMVTKTPETEAFYRGTFGLGTDEYKRTTLDINQPLDDLGASSNTAVRLNALIHRNDNPGRKVSQNERWGIAPSIAFGLDTETRLTASYFFLSQDNIPDYGIPWVPATNTAIPYYQNKPAPVDFSNFYGLSGRDYEETRTNVVTVEFEHDFTDDYTLRNLFRYGRTYRDSLITAPRFLNNTSTTIRRSDEKSRDQTDSIFANQTELISHFETFDLEHRLVTGIEYIHEVDTNRDRQPTGPDSPPTDLFSPDPSDPYLENYKRTGLKATAKANTLSLYAFDNIAVTDWLDINGGLRWDYFEVNFGGNTGDPLQKIDAPLSWNAGLVLKPQENGSIYFGYGVSFNPSAEGLTLSNSVSTRTTSNAIYADPERTQTFEVGTKWDFLKEKLSLVAAFFMTHKTNARTQDPADATDLTVLDGRQRIYGVELGATGNITDDWNIFAGYTMLESEILESKDPAEVGRDISNAPDHSFNLWTTYKLPFHFEVGAGLNYVGSRFSNDTNVRKADDYLIFDLMAAYKFKDHLTFRMNFYNVTDTEYIGSVGGGHFIPGAGRSLVFTTELEFG